MTYMTISLTISAIGEKIPRREKTFERMMDYQS